MTSGRNDGGLHGTHGISMGMYDSDKQTDLRSKAKHTEVRMAAMRGHSLGLRTSVKGRARGAFGKAC